MNYLAQFNGFWNWRKLNEISHPAVDLYFGLLDLANSAGCTSSLSIPNSKLVRQCDFSDASQLSKIRNQLVQLGLIKYIPGKKGRAGKYYIKELNRCQIYNDTDNNPDNNTGSNPDSNTGSNPDSNTAVIPTTIPATYINKTKLNETKLDITPYSPPQKKPNKKKLEDVLDEVDDPALRTALEGFVDMRKAKKNPLTPHALELQLKKLYGMSADSAERVDIVETAVMKGWLSFYPLKKQINPGQEDPFEQIGKERGYL